MCPFRTRGKLQSFPLHPSKTGCSNKFLQAFDAQLFLVLHGFNNPRHEVRLLHKGENAKKTEQGAIVIERVVDRCSCQAPSIAGREITDGPKSLV